MALDKHALGEAVKAVMAGPPAVEASKYPDVNQIALAIEAYLRAIQGRNQSLVCA